MTGDSRHVPPQPFVGEMAEDVKERYRVQHRYQERQKLRFLVSDRSHEVNEGGAHGIYRRDSEAP